MNTEKTSKKEIILAVVLAFVLAFVVFAFVTMSLGSTMKRVEWEEIEYCVSAGETLWDIAQEYCPESVDCREWINAVLDLNGMQDSTLYAGDVLTVLVPV